MATQSSILQILGANGPKTIREIRSQVDNAWTSTVIRTELAAMSFKGWVQQERGVGLNRADRFKLTVTGNAILKRVQNQSGTLS